MPKFCGAINEVLQQKSGVAAQKKGVSCNKILKMSLSNCVGYFLERLCGLVFWYNSVYAIIVTVSL